MIVLLLVALFFDFIRCDGTLGNDRFALLGLRLALRMGVSDGKRVKSRHARRFSLRHRFDAWRSASFRLIDDAYGYRSIRVGCACVFVFVCVSLLFCSELSMEPCGRLYSFGNWRWSLLSSGVCLFGAIEC